MGFSSSDFGSVANMELVKTRLAESRVLRLKGAKVKMARWWSLLDRVADVIPEWYSLAFATCLFAIRKGHFESMTEIVTASGDLTPVSQESHEETGASELASRREQLQRATLRTAVSVLAHPMHFGIAKMICETSSRVRLASGIGVQAQTSVEGSVRLLAERSVDANMSEVSSVAETLFSSGCLERIGVMPQTTTSVSLSDADQHVLGEHLCAYATHLMGARLLSNLAWQYTLPNALWGLLHESGECRSSRLKELKEMWVVLVKAESEARTNTKLRALLRDMVWPGMQTCRLVLAELAEADFECVPSSVGKLLQDCAEGFATTKVTEDVIGECRRVQDQGQSKSMSSESRWLAMLHSRALSNHGRTEVKFSTGSGVHGTTWPTNVFDPEFRDQTADIPPALQQKVEQSSEWVSPSASGLDQMPLQFLSLSANRTNLDLVDRVWLSSLASVGMAITNVADKRNGVVLHASQNGVLIWGVSTERLDEKVYLKFRTSPGKRHWDYVSVTDLAQWKAIRYDVVVPRDLAAIVPPVGGGAASSTAGSTVASTVIRLRKSANVEPLLHASAALGFVNLTVAHLRRLVQIGEVVLPDGERKPTNEEGWVKSVAKAVLGTSALADAAWLNRCRAKHRAACRPVLDTALTQKLDEDADDDWGGGKMESPLTHCNRAQQQTSVRQTVREKDRRKARPVREGDTWTVARIETLVPPGCTIHLEDNSWHRRWRAEFRDLQDCRFSKCFGASITETAAVREVVKWSWMTHKSLCGEACPFQLSDVGL
eukprot:5120199-Amphidinium_carterae.3